MTSYNGVTWRVNYGEVSEREQFRVGRLSLESYDAYFPLSQLQDLIDTLNAVTPLGLSVIARGSQVQAVKVSDGLLTSVVISPRLDTGTPVESMRLPLSELTDLLYALSLFRSDTSALPDDWDFSKPVPIKEDLLPAYLRPDELNATIARVASNDVADDASDLAAAVAAKTAREAVVLFNVAKFGATPSGSLNRTSQFQAALDAAGAVAGAGVGGVVQVPPGNYRVDNLVIPDFVTLEGYAGSTSRFGPQTSLGNSSVNIQRYSAGSSNPVITLAGYASGLKNVQIAGAAGTGTIVVAYGFETTIEDIRIINGTGIGLDVQKANNNRWRNVFVDNCGSASLPAVKVWSKTGVGGANETNSFDIYGLTIERSANTALEIGVGATADQWWAEWVRIFGLHIESSSQNIGVGASTGNTSSLVRIGNVRQLELVSPFIYGGPGYLLEHNQLATRSYGNGGIRIIGGSLNGSDTSTGVAATATLVKLTAGDDFAAIGTRFMRHTAAAIRVEAAYGSQVLVSPESTFAPGIEAISEGRTNPSPIRQRGDLDMRGRIHASMGPGTLGGAAGIGTAPPALTRNGSEVAGTIFWGTGTSPSAGAQVNYVFTRAYTTAPKVIISPANAATAGLMLYVGSSTLGFTVYAVNAPSASQANGTYSANFLVVGTDAL